MGDSFYYQGQCRKIIVEVTVWARIQ